jgi:hypothetical protein
MALTPSLSYTERNDNKALTVTDTTVDYGTGGNLDVTAITTLTLDITITTSDGTETTYDQIDLVDLFGDGTAPEFDAQADMVFLLNCTHLKDGGTAIGTATDELPDGVYDFVYIINGTTTYTESILVEGRIRVAVYELLRGLPTTYNCAECKTKETMDAIYCYGLLNVMESSGYVAKNEELINQLYVLERLVTNGSSYSW